MNDRPPTTATLLTAWRDAIKAAELAERLAHAAVTATEDADRRVIASAELAELAEQAAAAASRAAEQAAAAAGEAVALATRLREAAARDALTVDSTKIAETDARGAYHDAVDRAGGDGRGRR